MISVLLIGAVAVQAIMAAPQGSAKQQVPIVAQDQDINFDGTYHYSFEGGDGTRATQDGVLKQTPDGAGEVSQGSFSYVGDDGKTYGLTYTADENGYQPSGDHLPVAPPIPPAIAKALAYLATKPPSKDDQ
ncbi:endocuticle structural glycoprotein SgAbd-3 [Nilaparvata lugens]|uniref:endocuticle structural glycoprotein SgAbd-3 n=1 Tax=Nilaparvata lugens TaxID=108931 RepID=UPI000B999616|nr:endocuticle structural glycoprotein SgAbd-3 [Nilaparvata lugens]